MTDYFKYFQKQLLQCTIKKKAFSDHPVPTHCIFAHIIKDQRQLKTVAIQILVSPRDYKLLSKVLSTTGQTMVVENELSEQSVSPSPSQHDAAYPSDKIISDIIISARVGPDLPEIAQTKVLIQTHLGDDFILNRVDGTNGLHKHSLCRYSTSHPDTCFYHRNKYCLGSTIFALVTSTSRLAIEETGSNSESNTETCTVWDYIWGKWRG